MLEIMVERLEGLLGELERVWNEELEVEEIEVRARRLVSNDGL